MRDAAQNADGVAQVPRIEVYPRSPQERRSGMGAVEKA